MCLLLIVSTVEFFQMSPTGEHVSDVSDVLSVGQVVDVRIREVRGTYCHRLCEVAFFLWPSKQRKNNGEEVRECSR